MENKIVRATNKKPKKAVFHKCLVLNAFNYLFSRYEKGFSDLRFQRNFSTAQYSLHLNDFFTTMDMEGMLEVNDYSAVHLLSFIAVFLDRVIGWTNKPVLTAIHSLYSEGVNQRMFCSSTFAEKSVAK